MSDPQTNLHFSWLSRLSMWLLHIDPEEREGSFGRGEKGWVFRASPRYFHYRLLQAVALQASLLFVFGSTVVAIQLAMNKPAPPAIRGLLIAVTALVIGVYILQLTAVTLSVRLEYELRWYRVSESALRIREGSWIVREMTMTFANVQNISIEQGPLQRMLGISDVKVVSAGGGGSTHANDGFDMHAAYFRGVEDPEAIRNLIMERQRLAKASASSGLGDPDEAREPATDAQEVSSSELQSVVRELRDEAARLRSVAGRAV